MPSRVKSPQREEDKEEREGRLGNHPVSSGRVLLFHPAILGLPGLRMDPRVHLHTVHTLASFPPGKGKAWGARTEGHRGPDEDRVQKRLCEAVLAADLASCKTNKPLKKPGD